jgi:hypothetical protein
MPARQLLVFKIGCIAAILTAMLHMAGHLAGPTPPANETEVKLLDLATSYKMPLPGGAQRSLMDFQTGFSLTYAVFLAMVGGAGLVVRRRASGDPLLMLAVARVFAGGGAVLVAISLTYFFIIPTICVAFMTVCFAIASVASPEAAG